MNRRSEIWVALAQQGRALMVAGLMLAGVAGDALAARNPGYSCSGSLDPAAELVCSDDELSRASSELSQVYYAVRGSVDQSLWQGYKQKAVEFLKAALRRCEIPAKAKVSNDRLSATKVCLLDDIRQQRAYWLAELRSLNKPEALEEATRSTDQNIRLQQALRDQGWLPADAEIDGVFGEGTRQAVRRMQTSRGMSATGLLSDATSGWILPRNEASHSNLPPCPSDQTAYWTNCVGTFNFSDGAKYVGEYRDDKRTGQGTYTWPNGDKYVGEYRDGKRTGQGTFTWPNGAKYVGEYRDGKQNGQGTAYNRDGAVIRNGIWQNDEFIAANALPPSVPLIPRIAGAPGNIFLVKEGGTFKVPVLINGVIPLHFIVDSGAADVSIPADVVMTLARMGTITDSDFVGEQTYILADGSKVKSKTFRIRQLKVGDRVIENVLGSISDVNGSLLLGQSFLSRFKRVSFDYSQGLLVLE